MALTIKKMNDTIETENKTIGYIAKDGSISYKKALIVQKNRRVSPAALVTDGTAIGVPLFVFVLLGSLLDREFHTHLYVFVGLGIGSIAAFYNLIRMVHKR